MSGFCAKAFQHLGAADSDNLKVEIHDWLAQATALARLDFVVG